MKPLQDQEREYREIKTSLDGTKPSAIGRSWRRTVREALPGPTGAFLDTLAPYCREILPSCLVGTGVVCASKLFFESIVVPVIADVARMVPIGYVLIALLPALSWVLSLLMTVSLTTTLVGMFAYLFGVEE